MRICNRILTFVVPALIALQAAAQEVRMANGVILKGEVVKTTQAGLEVKSGATVKSYPWETLAPSTRYRYEPLFRANYEAVLQGLPASARTKKPDEEVPVISAQEAKPPAENVPSQPAAPSRSDLTLIEQIAYEPVQPIRVSQFPSAELKSPETTLLCGFQFGPSKDEVLYLAFDARGAKDVRDTLIAFTPTHSAFSSPLRITGFKKTTSDSRVVTFKKFPLTASFGAVAVSYEIECIAQQTLAEVAVILSVQLSRENARSRFQLYGTLKDFAQSDGLIPVLGILDMPTLWLGLENSTTPRLVGNLTMSHMNLVPREGMGNRLAVSILNDKNETVQELAIKMDDTTTAQPYGIGVDLKKVEVDQEYTIKAAMDLGTLMGTTSYEDTFILLKK